MNLELILLRERKYKWTNRIDNQINQPNDQTTNRVTEQLIDLITIVNDKGMR